MARIGIIEDSDYDASERYKSILTENEVYLVLIDQTTREKEVAQKSLQRKGFDMTRFYFELDQMPTDLDVYFCDGLKGQCLEVANRFGKERTYIQTSSHHIEEQASQRGYKIRSESLQEIIKRHSK